MAEVIVVGAGPVGTLLAARLRLAGVDVELLERRGTVGAGSRAIGLHAPTLAALEADGVTDRILANAVRVRQGEARSDGRLLGTVRFDRLQARHPYVATLPQAATEAALSADAPAARRGVTVTAIRSDPHRVRVCTDGDDLSAAIVVVAAGVGARDLVFRPGGVRRTAYPDSYLMTDAAVPPRDDHDTAVVHLAAGGVLESFPLPGGRRRFVAWDATETLDAAAAAAPDAAPDAADHAAARLARLRAAMRERGEADAADGIDAATSFRVRRVLAPAMRHGRLFVIGDTAHEISPIGGQGLNLGLLDAATLAPLLVDWVHRGTPPEPDLRHWERERLRSARVAGHLAAANMRLGRPVSNTAHALRARALGGVLGATGGLLAHAYAMGFDSAAR